MNVSRNQVVTRDHSLESLLFFNALSALVGGVALISGIISPPLNWLNRTIFTSYTIPGLILFLVVGGSSLVAYMMTLRHRRMAPLAATAAGLIMCGWILNEVALLQRFHWLQALFFLIGSAIIALTYDRAKSFLITKDNYFL